MRLTGKISVMLAAAGLLAVGSLARAESITLQLIGGPTLLGSGEYAYVYQATLAADVTGGMSTISNNGNSMFTIVDFGGLDVAATTADLTNGTDNFATVVPGSNWSFSNPGTQGLNVGIFSFDSTAIPDATFTYTGTTPVTVTNPASLVLGDFTIVSTVSSPTPLHFYGANDTESIPDGLGGYITDPESNQSLILAPGPGGPSAVPSPATSIGGIALLSLFGLGGLFYKRQRTA